MMAAVLCQQVASTAKSPPLHGAAEMELVDPEQLKVALERNLALQGLLNQRLFSLRMKLSQVRQVQASLSFQSPEASAGEGGSTSVSSRSGTRRIDEHDPFAIQAAVPLSRKLTPRDTAEELEQELSQSQPTPVHSTLKIDQSESLVTIPSLSQRFRLNAATGRTLNEVVLAAVEELPIQVDEDGEPVPSTAADDPEIWRDVAAIVAGTGSTKQLHLDPFTCSQVWHHTLHPNAGRLSTSSSMSLGSAVAERLKGAPITQSTWIQLQCHFPGASAFDLLSAFRQYQTKSDDTLQAKKGPRGPVVDASLDGQRLFLGLLRQAVGTDQDQSTVLAAFGDLLFGDTDHPPTADLPPRGRLWISKFLRKEHIKNDSKLWDSSCDIRLDVGVHLYGKRWEDIAEGLFYTGEFRRRYSEDLPIYLQWRLKDVSSRRAKADRVDSQSGLTNGRPIRLGPILRQGGAATPRPPQASVPPTEHPSRAASEWATPSPSQPWGDGDEDDAL